MKTHLWLGIRREKGNKFPLNLIEREKNSSFPLCEDKERKDLSSASPYERKGRTSLTIPSVEKKRERKELLQRAPSVENKKNSQLPPP
jgi:hypothetical protein